jgi:hypothetical protein
VQFLTAVSLSPSVNAYRRNHRDDFGQKPFTSLSECLRTWLIIGFAGVNLHLDDRPYVAVLTGRKQKPAQRISVFNPLRVKNAGLQRIIPVTFSVKVRCIGPLLRHCVVRSRPLQPTKLDLSRRGGLRASSPCLSMCSRGLPSQDGADMDSNAVSE